MKYHNIKIVKVQWVKAIDIGKREDSPVKNVYGTGYNYAGGSYPMELQECKDSIDLLISQVMERCSVEKPEAIKLINTL